MRVADNSEDFKHIKCSYCLLAVDESTDINSTAQIRIFSCTVTSDLQGFEERVDFSSMQGQAKFSYEGNESKH
jgi:hypothetical protein